MEGFGDLRNLRFSEEWVKNIHILKKEGHQKRNWFKRIHPKFETIMPKDVEALVFLVKAVCHKKFQIKEVITFDS